MDEILDRIEALNVELTERILVLREMARRLACGEPLEELAEGCCPGKVGHYPTCPRNQLP